MLLQMTLRQKPHTGHIIKDPKIIPTKTTSKGTFVLQRKEFGSTKLMDYSAVGLKILYT